jgi:hypothetical protein
MRDTRYVNASSPEEIKPPKDKTRDFLFIQNTSEDAVYYEEGMIATSENGIEIGAGQFVEFDRSMGRAVPPGNIWITGSVVAPNRQRIIVKQG